MSIKNYQYPENRRYKNEDRALFQKPADELAKWLLGKIICRYFKEGDFVIKGRIVETEAYLEKDPDCDAKRLTTKISQLEDGGTLYVCMRNRWLSWDIVANTTGVGEGVLIKRIDCYIPTSHPMYAMDIDEKFDGVDLLNSKEIWLEDDGVKVKSIKKPRINTKTDAPLRFIATGLTFSETWLNEIDYKRQKN